MTLLYSIVYILGHMFFSGPEVFFPDGRIVQYGRIKEGGTAVVEVTIKNTGDEDLIIYQAITTCNCTSVEYPRFIRPSETGAVGITVNTSGKFGNESIVVKIRDNSQKQYSVIRIDLDVYQ